MKDGKYYIFVKNGKGGRKRLSEIIGSEEDVAFVIDTMQKAGERKVFDKIPDIDIHALRAEYAKSVYEKYAECITDEQRAELLIRDVHLWCGKPDPYLYTAEVAIIRDGEEIDKN